MHVGIIGGGFAGRMATVRLRRAGHTVTLVDARPGFVERTRMHEAIARGRSITTSHAAFTGRLGATFVHARVIGIDDGEVVHTDGTLSFDRTLIAVGSVPDHSLPGIADHAHSLTGPTACARAHQALGALSAGSRVVVVGAGLTGLEVSTEIADAWPALRITLLGDPTVGLSAGGAQIVNRALEALGVTVSKARVRSLGPSGPETTEGHAPAALTVWAGGLRAPRWLERAGLPLDALGRIQVDDDLRVVGHPTVLAAGDCASTPLVMACATALPLACHAADTLIREAAGRETLPFDFGYAARFISLGRGRALAQHTRADGTPTDLTVGGRFGAWLKEGVLRYGAHVPSWEHRAGLRLYAAPSGRGHQLTALTREGT